MSSINLIKVPGFIRQPEGHDQPLKKAILGFEVNFPYICGIYWNLVDPGPGVTKDPSKTFYFQDVLNLIFKRT